MLREHLNNFQSMIYRQLFASIKVLSPLRSTIEKKDKNNWNSLLPLVLNRGYYALVKFLLERKFQKIPEKVKKNIHLERYSKLNNMSLFLTMK